MRLTSLILALCPLLLTSAQITPQSPDLPLSTRLFNLGKNTMIGPPPLNTTLRDIADREAGILRLTDENYDEKVKKGGVDDVWVVVLYGAPNEPVNKIFLEAHTNATLLSQSPTSNITKNIHFAQVDYSTEKELTTRWFVFRPPYMVIITDQGRNLRFYGPKNINARGEMVYKFVEQEGWGDHPVWGSVYGPGGDREWLTNLFVEYYSKWTEFSSKIPNFGWLLLTGAISRGIMGWMHAPPAPTQATTTTRVEKTPEQVRREKALRAALLKKGKKE